MISNARLREAVGSFGSGAPVFRVAFNSLGPTKRYHKKHEERKLLYKLWKSALTR